MDMKHCDTVCRKVVIVWSIGWLSNVKSMLLFTLRHFHRSVTEFGGDQQPADSDALSLPRPADDVSWWWRTLFATTCWRELRVTHSLCHNLLTWADIDALFPTTCWRRELIVTHSLCQNLLTWADIDVLFLTTCWRRELIVTHSLCHKLLTWADSDALFPTTCWQRELIVTHFL